MPDEFGGESRVDIRSGASNLKSDYLNPKPLRSLYRLLQNGFRFFVHYWRISLLRFQVALENSYLNRFSGENIVSQ
jgi:hypothetical protein